MLFFVLHLEAVFPAYYKPEGLDEQLDMATLAYLKGEAEYLEKENTLYLPMLMNWFRGDFGGKKNIKRKIS